MYYTIGSQVFMVLGNICVATCKTNKEARDLCREMCSGNI